MEATKCQRALELVADAIETGYSSVFTYTYKEYLTRNEKTQFVSLLRTLADNPGLLSSLGVSTVSTQLISDSSSVEMDEILRPSSSPVQ